jgi:23S rRNA (pseudouridine1915-N3)-methyltransferase
MRPRRIQWSQRGTGEGKERKQKAESSKLLGGEEAPRHEPFLLSALCLLLSPSLPMRFLLISVGKIRAKEMSSLVGEYENRAGRYWPLEVVEVREESARSRTAAEVKAKEGERLLEAVGGALVVACDERGTMLRSEEFAEWLREEREKAVRDVAFVIGGAYGLSEELLARAERRVALARWTLPHELARLVLVEQLYRAGTILRGEPYHK